MPGHKLYRVMRLFDDAKRYWYWGSLSSYRYNLGQSDKALVEAKTLFEYRQYLLAVHALERSNRSLQRVPDFLRQAKDKGKNIEKYIQEFGNAMDEHKRLITAIKQDTPEKFTWAPEKNTPQVLSIRQALFESEKIRNEITKKLP
jgi:predicted  nucleic acid-binding Zn-ribbon protein